MLCFFQGALWHIYAAEDADKIRDCLRAVSVVLVLEKYDMLRPKKEKTELLYVLLRRVSSFVVIRLSRSHSLTLFLLMFCQ